MHMTCGHRKAKEKANYAFAFVNGGKINVIDKKGKLTPYVRKLIKRYRKYNPVVVFNLGLNGNRYPARNARRIIRVYRDWMEKYPDIRFFVASINPTIVAKGPYADNKVVKLNQLLRKEFEQEGIWIDTYTYIKKHHIIRPNGYGMIDEADKCHYNWNTSARILTLVRKKVFSSNRKGAD